MSQRAYGLRSQTSKNSPKPGVLDNNEKLGVTPRSDPSQTKTNKTTNTHLKVPIKPKVGLIYQNSNDEKADCEKGTQIANRALGSIDKMTKMVHRLILNPVILMCLNYLIPKLSSRIL